MYSYMGIFDVWPHYLSLRWCRVACKHMIEVWGLCACHTCAHCIALLCSSSPNPVHTCSLSASMAPQAAQVRKSAFVVSGDDGKQTYHPETHRSCTIYAGTVVQQVRLSVSALYCRHLYFLVENTLKLWTASGQCMSPIYVHACTSSLSKLAVMAVASPHVDTAAIPSHSTWVYRRKFQLCYHVSTCTSLHQYHSVPCGRNCNVM